MLLVPGDGYYHYPSQIEGRLSVKEMLLSALRDLLLGIDFVGGNIWVPKNVVYHIAGFISTKYNSQYCNLTFLDFLTFLLQTTTKARVGGNTFR